PAQVGGNALTPDTDRVCSHAKYEIVVLRPRHARVIREFQYLRLVVPLAVEVIAVTKTDVAARPPAAGQEVEAAAAGEQAGGPGVADRAAGVDARRVAPVGAHPEGVQRHLARPQAQRAAQAAELLVAERRARDGAGRGRLAAVALRAHLGRRRQDVRH